MYGMTHEMGNRFGGVAPHSTPAQVTGAPAPGSTTKVTGPDLEAQNKLKTDMLTGVGTFNLMGHGDEKAGAIGQAIGDHQMTAGASLGYKHGQNASNPWEAFIAGGVGSYKDIAKNPETLAFHPTDPVNTFVGGGIGGVTGLLF